MIPSSGHQLPELLAWRFSSLGIIDMGIVVGVEVVSVSGGLCRAIRIDTHSIIGIDFFWYFQPLPSTAWSLKSCLYSTTLEVAQLDQQIVTISRMDISKTLPDRGRKTAFLWKVISGSQGRTVGWYCITYWFQNHLQPFQRLQVIVF